MKSLLLAFLLTITPVAKLGEPVEIINTLNDFPKTYELSFDEADAKLLKEDIFTSWSEMGLYYDGGPVEVTSVGLLGAACHPLEEYCSATSVTLIVRPATTSCPGGAPTSVCPDLSTIIATYDIPLATHKWSYGEVDTSFTITGPIYFLFRVTGSSPWHATYLQGYDTSNVKYDQPAGACSTPYQWSYGDFGVGMGVVVTGHPLE